MSLMDPQISITAGYMIDDFSYKLRQFKLNSLTKDFSKIIEYSNYKGKKIIVQPREFTGDYSIDINDNDNIYDSVKLYSVINISFTAHAVTDIGSYDSLATTAAKYYADKKRLLAKINSKVYTWDKIDSYITEYKNLEIPLCKIKNFGINNCDPTLDGYDIMLAENSPISIHKWHTSLPYHEVSINLVGIKEIKIGD